MDDKNSKEKILRMASELFNKFGVRSISMDDIAHHLGISKKTIYQYFSDKDEIVTLATLQFLSQEKETVQTLQLQSKDAVDFLIKVSHFLRRNISETTSSIVYELQKYHRKAWDLLQDFKKQFLFDVIRENLKTGIVQGHFRSEINPDITSKIRLEEAYIALNQEIFPKDEYDLKTVSDNILEHFVFGITTEKGRKLYQKYKNQIERKNSSNTLQETRL